MQSFKYLIIFLFGMSIAALLWGIGLFFLKKEPIIYMPSKKDYSFYSINLTSLFFNSLNSSKQIKTLDILKGVKLKGLYFDGKDGFVILSKNGKNFFVDLGKSYNGYKLVEIGKNYAVFEKDLKKYKVEMEKSKNLYKGDKTAQIKTVDKSVFNDYLRDFNKIWENIGIVKYKRGYLITYIKKDSIFDKMGLKKGDILMEINNRKLKNDKDAWDLYKHAKEFKSFEIKILRSNRQKVLYYEVD